ncbi:Xylulose-5-phosphate phosphoketolase @ Fructose-6-phosphate phosphoketolase [hydrothermal vent metagenome]|uniref:Xylulose-5-phosphate phosphoketolase @ Fructose-6-phosphate phosphoketolase n=1 Tax=hydrothermal vent metagenome TaxID=652676 RepID=A0A3B0XB73_9ZZZZ
MTDSASANMNTEITKTSIAGTIKPLSDHELKLLHSWWRAANYLSAGQIFLMDNPLLQEPLLAEHIKPRQLGHWGTTPGLNLLYAHMNRIIKRDDINAIFITGPGHGGPALVASTWMEGSYSELYPQVSQDTAGMKNLFKQFSFPGGIPSHCAPETPGSINEGGELGYSLSHAFGAVFDNPDLLALCVVGDGEAETGPLATAWHGNKFINPARDGVVLPVLHLNGYKIANPAVLARIDEADLIKLFEGYGYHPYVVSGNEPEKVHQQLAATFDSVMEEITQIQNTARHEGNLSLPRWPMIILRTPKGWTGPKQVDGLKVEDYWRAHQVPITDVKKPEHIKILDSWMRSYHAEELFDDNGQLKPEIAALAPSGDRRMGANPHANGGLLLKPLKLPDYEEYAVEVGAPGDSIAEATRRMGEYLRDVMQLNMKAANFRIMGPDETASNRLGALLDVTDRVWMADKYDYDDHLAADGRVMEILSEHTCQGWLEGYLLTGRHGLFSCYEAFIHIVDSMFNQHAKWLKVCNEIPWRADIASLNILLTSHVWRQDHNGFSHQDPGFIDHVVNKKAGIVRIYLPPDANTLLCVTHQCLNSRNLVNVIVSGKQPEPQWLDMDAAIKHCSTGIGIWEWASNDQDTKPDVIMACCGDVPTIETLAAVKLLHQLVPELRIRVINVVDLMTLQPREEHPHGLSDADFDALFGTDIPVIFAFHGYPWLIHRLIYRRNFHHHLHVRGYKEEGTTTTAFDMVVINELDRFHLVMDVVDRVPKLTDRSGHLHQSMHEKLVEHREYINRHGEDMAEIKNWKWTPA